jgi:hypothetical protein
MSPATSTLGIRQSISTTRFPCVFLYSLNPSWFWSAMSSLISRVSPQYHSNEHGGSKPVAYPGIFFRMGGGGGVYARNFFSGRGGFNKFSWGQRAERTPGWGRQPPTQGFHSFSKWMKPVFWLGCYGCTYIPRNWEFGSALAKLRNFGGGVKLPNPRSVLHCSKPFVDSQGVGK